MSKQGNIRPSRPRLAPGRPRGAALRDGGAAAVGWEPDGTAELAPGGEADVPRCAGVYVIHDVRGALYVGSSADLRRRFVQHDRLRRSRVLRGAMERPVGVLAFDWVRVAHMGRRLAMERSLVNDLRPACNGRPPATPPAKHAEVHRWHS